MCHQRIVFRFCKLYGIDYRRNRGCVVKQLNLPLSRFLGYVTDIFVVILNPQNDYILFALIELSHVLVILRIYEKHIVLMNIQEYEIQLILVQPFVCQHMIHVVQSLAYVVLYDIVLEIDERVQNEILSYDRFCDVVVVHLKPIVFLHVTVFSLQTEHLYILRVVQKVLLERFVFLFVQQFELVVIVHKHFQRVSSV